MNTILLAGEISGFKLSHECHGKKFYEFTMNVKRRSGRVDEIPCVVDEDKISMSEYDIKDGLKISVFGDVRMRFKKPTVSVQNFYKYTCDKNSVHGTGTVTGLRRYRKRTIGTVIDFTIISMRSKKGIDKIPSVAFEKTADDLNELGKNNQKIEIYFEGRIESRKFENGEKSTTVRELTVTNFEIINDTTEKKGDEEHDEH